MVEPSTRLDDERRFHMVFQRLGIRRPIFLEGD